MIIFYRQMQSDEIKAAIDTCDYLFSEEEIPRPDSIQIEWRYYNTYYITSPAVYWIFKRKTVPPKILLTKKPWMTDEYGYTYAMWWIKLCESDVPKEFHHYPLIKNLNGETCAAMWIMHCFEDIPKWMRHDPIIKTNTGLTCAMIWIIYRREDVPEYLKHAPDIKTERGITCMIYWLITTGIEETPLWMKHDTNLKDIKGWTYETYLWHCRNSAVIYL